MNIFRTLEYTDEQLELRGDAYIQDVIETYLEGKPEDSLEFINFSDNIVYFGKVTMFMEKRGIKYTIERSEKTLVGRIFTSVIVDRDELLSYTEKYVCDF